MSEALLPAPVILPLLAALIAFVAGRRAAFISVVWGFSVAAAALIAVFRFHSAGAGRLPIGGWHSPVAIPLALDGLTATLLALTAVVAAAVLVFAARGARPAPSPAFYPLWFLLWAGLNALFLSRDIFNLYVTLELVGMSAVGLVALNGERGIQAATRYLFLGLIGSLAYLLGVAVLYQTHGTLDLIDLGRQFQPGPADAVALGLIAAGLFLKAALFPMHGWLPGVHANAAPPVSAALSALVVKGPFFVFALLWIVLYAQHAPPALAQGLGFLGACAILTASIQALRAGTLKELIAHSTVAQLGYLMLAFPLSRSAEHAAGVWGAAACFLCAHALAKSALFLSAGLLTGDGPALPLSRLGACLRAQPRVMLTVVLAGMSLVGLPPSGGFLGKWLLLTSSVEQGQWWWCLVLALGSLLSGAYILRLVQPAFAQDPEPAVVPTGSHWSWVSLGLAAGAVALGFFAGLPATWVTTAVEALP